MVLWESIYANDMKETENMSFLFLGFPVIVPVGVQRCDFYFDDPNWDSQYVELKIDVDNNNQFLQEIQADIDIMLNNNAPGCVVGISKRNYSEMVGDDQVLQVDDMDI